jgi:hypothetical protein
MALKAPYWLWPHLDNCLLARARPITTPYPGYQRGGRQRDSCHLTCRQRDGPRRLESLLEGGLNGDSNQLVSSC